MNDERWPELHYDDWKDTAETLHRWTQIVGKIRLVQESLINHWWNVSLYVTPRGLTTHAMPYLPGRSFSIEFDFIGHALRIEDCDGGTGGFALEPMTVAAFYRKTMDELRTMALPVKIHTKPNEMPDATPLDRDTAHASYDPVYAERFWRVLVQMDRLCREFRKGFIGKVSPVHFFWGGFDLACTRFSGRPAPPYPGGVPNVPNSVMVEAYSHEVHSVGFWPGGFGLDAQIYAYAYPWPPAFAQAAVKPAAATWNADLKEFVLPYEAVRTSADPDADVLAFFQSTYDAEADLAHWDRAALERAVTPPNS